MSYDTPYMFEFNIQKLSSCNLAGTKATRTYSNCLGCTLNYCLYLTDVGLPCSVCLTVGVRNVLTENNTLTTNTALCHFDTSSHFHAYMTIINYLMFLPRINIPK